MADLSPSERSRGDNIPLGDGGQNGSVVGPLLPLNKEPNLKASLSRTRFPSSLAIIDILLTRPFREPLQPITPSCL